jgi:cell fate (sporulation/competence/biofilm development) regulator YmcA (YheA/YmcA/DUF963 family)
MSSTVFEALDQLNNKQLERIAKLKTELDMKQIELKIQFETEMKKKIAEIKADQKQKATIFIDS